MQFTCPEQIGGFNNVGVYLLSETSNWPPKITDHNSNQITFNETPESIYGTIVPESIRITEPSKVLKAGELYTVKISFDFSSQSPAMDQLLDQFKGEKVVAKACKNFPQIKLFGTNKFPLQLSYQTIHGYKPETGSLTKITVTGKVPFRSVHVLE